MIGPPNLSSPQVMPAVRPVSGPVPVPVPLPAPVPVPPPIHNPSPTVANIPAAQHLMRPSLSSASNVPVPVPVARPGTITRAPPPLVPDHLHAQVGHAPSPASHLMSLPGPTPHSAMSGSLPVPRPLDVAVASSSTTPIPSLSAPPLSAAPTPVRPPAHGVTSASQQLQTSSVPSASLLHAPPPPLPPSTLRSPTQPIMPVVSPPQPALPTPSVAPAVTAGPTVTVFTPHSPTTLPPPPVLPSQGGDASQSLHVLPTPPPLVLGGPLRTISDSTTLRKEPTGPAAAATVAAQADMPRPVPPSVSDLPRRSYLASVYPTAEALPDLQLTRVGFLGMVGAPRVLPHPAMAELGADGNNVQVVPQPIGPAYIVFGGARYDSLLLTVPKPPFRTPVPTSDRNAARREEMRRARHLTDQLEVAHEYLHLTSGSRAGCAVNTRSPVLPETSAASAAPPAVDTSDLVVTKNVWNAAYSGSPSDLSAFIDADPSKEVMESVGYVVHSRRQWGLKRNNEVYELGLGQKGTPLQFAAVSGKLDNVLLLLAFGARDNQRPFLKELLPSEPYSQIRALFKPSGVKKSKKTRQFPQNPALAGATTPPTEVAHSTNSLSSKAITLYAFEMEAATTYHPFENPA